MTATQTQPQTQVQQTQPQTQQNNNAWDPFASNDAPVQTQLPKKNLSSEVKERMATMATLRTLTVLSWHPPIRSIIESATHD